MLKRTMLASLVAPVFVLLLGCRSHEDSSELTASGVGWDAAGRGQIEGSIIFALSAVQYGGVEIEGGRVKRDNFHDNRLLRIDEVPEMEVEFVSSGEPPMGLGEPGTPPLAPAVLNAIYDASGIRVRKIPVLKEDLVDKKTDVA